MARWPQENWKLSTVDIFWNWQILKMDDSCPNGWILHETWGGCITSRVAKLPHFPWNQLYIQWPAVGGNSYGWFYDVLLKNENLLVSASVYTFFKRDFPEITIAKYMQFFLNDYLFCPNFSWHKSKEIDRTEFLGLQAEIIGFWVYFWTWKS